MSDVSKKARRDQAREHAREMREKEAKRKRRNGWIIKGSVGLALVAIAVVTVLVFNNVRQAEIEAATPKPGPANMLSDGILLTADSSGSGEIVAVPTAAIAPKGEPVATDPTKYTDTVNIVTYVDYFCPICQAFEQANSEQISTWVAAGVATLEVHPIAILDGSSVGTRYSSRSANAMACVAEYQPNSYLTASDAMYANQPPEATSGLTNDEIFQVLSGAGITDPQIKECIDKESFKQWVTAATERTKKPLPNSELPGVAGTPTVLVNGVQFTGAPNDPQAFIDFISAIAMSTMTPPEETAP